MISKIIGLVLITPFFGFITACFQVACYEIKNNRKIIMTPGFYAKITKQWLLLLYGLEFLVIGLYLLFK